LATIRNTIRTDFVESGADRVTDATDTLGRSQTRLGQASASAGRSFAAQSQGLGGLVGAYAGAAATVFALQAAFDALSKAAQAENIVRGTSALASEIGQSGPKILQSIKDITQGQLTLEEASNSANLALSSGFNTKQIEDLSKVALGASRALGRNLTDAMTRVVRGAAKMEPELLDELGIFTRIEPAVDAYARKMNIAASTMTDFERRQAFLNAVIDEGTRKFANIDVNGQSAQKSLEQLSVKVVELGTQFGQLINEFLLPVVNFFKNDFGNTMLLFLGVLTLVFSKAGAIVGGFATNGIASLAAFTTRMSDAAANMGTLDLSGVETSAQTARDHAYNTNDGQQRQGSFNPRIAGETAENTAELSRAVAAQSDGTLNNTRALRANNAVLERNRDLLAEGAPRRRYLNRLIEINTEAINSSNRASRGLARTTELLQTGVRGLGVAFNILGKAVNAIFGIIAVAQLVGTIFDVDILGAVLDRFSAITAATKRLDDGFAALISTTSASGASIAEQFKSIGSDTEAIEGIKNRVIALRDAVKDEAVIFKTRNDMVDASFEKFDKLNAGTAKFKNFQARKKEGITGQIDVGQEAIDTAAGTTINSAEGPKMGGSAALTGEIERANELIFEQNKLMLVNGQFTKFNLLDTERQNKLLEMQAELSDKILNIERFRRNIKASAGGTQKTEATNAEKQLFIQNKITETIKEINRLYEENPESEALQTARENLIIEKKFQDLLEKRMESYPALAAGLSQATGKSIEDIGESISKVFDGKDIDLFGEKLVKIGGKFDYAIQSKEVKDLAEAFVIADSTLSDLTDGFENGATTSSAMSKGIFGIKSQLEAIKDQGKENTPLFQRLEKELKQLEAYNDELKRSEALGKAIDKAFGSQIKAADNAISSGDISQYGTLATDDETRLTNQRELLTLASQEAAIAQQGFKTRKDQVRELNRQFDGLKGIRAEQLKMNEADEDKVAQGRKAQKAAKGVALEMSKNLTTQIEAESKKEQKLKDQLKILNHEMMIKGLIVAETIKEIEVREAAAGREQMIKVTEKRLELLKAVNNIQQQQFEQEAAMTAENNKRLNIQREIVIAQRQGAAAAVLAAKESAVGIQGGLLETDAAQGANTQLEQRKALISMEKDLAVSSLQEEKNILNEQAEFENTKINIERQIIKDRQDQIDKEISQLEAQNQLEIAIQAAKTRQSVQAIKDQKDNLKRDADLNKIKLDKDRINIAAQRAIRVIDQTILDRQMKLAEVNEAFVYEFSTAINKLAEVVDIIKDTSTAPIPALDLSTKLIADLNTLADTQGAVFLKQGDILDQQETQITLNAEGIDKILEAELGLADTKIANIEALGVKELELLRTKQAGSLQELKAEKSLLSNKLETLNLADQQEAQALTTSLAAIDEKIKSEEMVALVANQTAEAALRQANEEKRLNDDLSTRKLTALENEKNALGVQARIAQQLHDIEKNNLTVLAMEKMSRDEALKVSEHALEIEKLTLDIANNLTDQLINEKKVRQEILAIENQLLTAQAEGAAIAAKAGAARSATEDQIKVQNFIADNRISGAAAAAIESSLKLKSLEQERQVIQSKIEESKRTAEVAADAADTALSIEQEISNLTVKRLTEEKDFVMSALELEVKKLDNSRIELAAATETNKKQIAVLELQRTAAATADRLASENRQNEYTLLKAKNQFLIDQIKFSKADIAARKDLAVEANPEMDTTNIDRLLASTELTTQLEAQNTALTQQEVLVGEIGIIQAQATEQQFKDKIELLNLENSLNDARIANIDSEIARQGALTVLQLSAIQDKIDAEKANFALAQQKAAAQSALEGQQNANKLADLEAQKEALIDQANIHNAQLLNSIKAENFAIQDTIKGLERELELLEAQAGIQQKQQELAEREADQANIRFAREESLRQSEQQLTLDRLRSDNEFRVSQALIEQLDIKKQIANVDAQIEKSTRETAKINASTERASFEASEQIRVQKLITDNQLSGAAAAILQNQLVTDNINNQKKLLDDQVTETERLLSDELAAAQESENIRLRGVALEVERLEAEKAFLIREQNFEKIKLQNAIKDLEFKMEANTLRKEIIELEKNAALETLRINTQQKLDQIDILKARNESVIKELKLVEKQAALEIQRRRTHAMVTGTPAQLGGLSDLADQSQVIGGLEEQNRLLDDQKKLITDIADVEKNKINNNATGQQTLLDKANQLLELEKQSIETRLQENITINKEKLTAIDDQIRLIKEASNLEGDLVRRNRDLTKAGAAEKLADLEKQKKALEDQVRIQQGQLLNAVTQEIQKQQEKTVEFDKQITALKKQLELQKLLNNEKVIQKTGQIQQRLDTASLSVDKARLNSLKQTQSINASNRAANLADFKMDQKRAKMQSDINMAKANAAASGAQAGISAAATKETATLQNKLDRSILNQRDTVMLQVKLAEVNLKAALASAGVKAGLAKEERAAALEELTRKKELLAEEKKNSVEAFAEEKEMLLAQQAILAEEDRMRLEAKQTALDTIKRQEAILIAQRADALEKNRLANEQRLFDLDLLEKQYKFIQDKRALDMDTLAKQAEVAGTDMPIQTDADRKLNQTIEDALSAIGVNKQRSGDIKTGQDALTNNNFDTQEKIRKLEQTGLLMELESIRKINDLNSKNRVQDLLHLDTRAAQAATQFIKQGEMLGLEEEMIEANFVAKMQAAGAEASAARELFKITKERLEYQLTAEAKLKDMVEALITNINDGLGNAINKVFDNIAEGKSIKDGLGDIFADTFENIRKTVLQKTLIEPAKDAFRGLVGNLIPGLGLNEEKGADNAKVIDGALLTTSGSAGGPSPAEKMKEDVEKKGMEFFDGFKEKAMNVFGSMKEGIGNFGTTALDTFKGLGGSLGNIFSSVTSGLGSLFGGGGAGGGGGLMSSIMGMFGGGAAGGGGGFMSTIMGMFGGAATGGLVGMTGVRNMAAGGQVNALRDRVPAMLEPGEFVMRRPAAKSIGAGNLSRMNATGAAGMGNVQFNIVNEGEPKSAEQQGQPKFDADKIVIDVVMRDLQSNGPIRNALRSG